MEDEGYRGAVAAELALAPAAVDTAVCESDEDILDVAGLIAKAEAVSPEWIVEIPDVGELFEKFADRKDVTVFHLDEIPGSLFATNQSLEVGKARVLVTDGLIGAPVTAPPEAVGKSSKVTKILKTAEERFVLGVVLAPETADSQGDIYSAEEVRKAAHSYMEKAAALGTQHSEIVTGKLKILENYVAPVDFEVDGESITKGTWLLGIRVVEDDLWTSIKEGSYTGFSIGGAAVRSPI